MNLSARLMTTVAAAALGLGLVPAAALAAPAPAPAVQQTDDRACGSHLEDWINGNGAAYLGTLKHVDGGHGTVEARVDINHDEVVLTLDENPGEPEAYEFNNGVITWGGNSAGPPACTSPSARWARS
ncbi:hypothetical protein [Actinomadura terrae]|uniref:hypothetical protein n=1 Tax=Actinomadura terrae TaxID=604353 RepID=UPI001FA6D75C|nr:hypothetical protein [Actinomadura terrae]